MAGTVYKPCRYKGCKRSACDHSWWMSYSRGNVRYRMSVDDFAKKDGVGKQEADEVWLPKFIATIREGRDPREGEKPTGGESMTVEQFIDREYVPRHILANRLSYTDSLKSKMNVLKKRFGDLPLGALEHPGPIEDFRTDLVGKGRAVASVNLYLAQIRHMVNWAIGRGFLTKTPFHRYGIRLLKGAARRTRRLYPDEEKRLPAATKKMQNARHWFQGAAMRERIIVALDTGVRRGEMLRIQNKHIDWKRDPNTHPHPTGQRKEWKRAFHAGRHDAASGGSAKAKFPWTGRLRLWGCRR